MKRDFVLVIPARLKSTRLPRKLLIEIDGKTIIQRSYECAYKSIQDRDKIIVATDSFEIKNICDRFGAKTILTSENCMTGTDRVAEVSEKIDADQYINLQGDEPIFPVDQLSLFIKEASKNPEEVNTAITRILDESDYRNFTIPKMVFSNSKKLLYSSRASIPSSKNNSFKYAYKHVCIYAFNKNHLKIFKDQTKKTKFELLEDLEINRFLELDVDVRCIELIKGGKAVDTEKDLEIVKKYILNNQVF